MQIPTLRALLVTVFASTALLQPIKWIVVSHHTLGINAPERDKVRFRKVTSCSPIHTKGYAKEVNVTDPTLSACGSTLLQINFGQVNGSNNIYLYNEQSTAENIGYILTYALPSTGESLYT